MDLENVIKKIETFSLLSGPAGNENEISDCFVSTVEPFSKSLYVDNLNQVIVNQFSTDEKKRILVSAHMDEIGFVVKNIQQNGLIRLSPIGSIDVSRCCNHLFRLTTKGTGKYFVGMINSISNVDIKNINNLYFDLNMTYDEVLKNGISIGDYIVPYSEFKIFNHNIFGKALDNRIGLGILAYLIEYLNENKPKLSNSEVCFAATCSEEFGLYGASTLANSLFPDIHINIDCVPVSEMPEDQIFVKMGNGVVIGIKCGSHLSDLKLVERFEEVCKSKNIIYQKGVFDFGTTDSQQFKRKGCKTLDLYIPIKCMHSSISVCQINDISMSLKAIIYFLLELL